MTIISSIGAVRKAASGFRSGNRMGHCDFEDRFWPKAEKPAARLGGRFLGHFGPHVDAAPEAGCDGLTEANNWRPVSKRVRP